MSDLKAKVSMALDRIGHHNGHAAPNSQDALDKVLHEYNIASIGSSHFEKRKELAKKLLYKQMGEDAASRIDDTKANVAKNEVATHVLVCQGQVYSLDAHVKNGASFLDTQSLKVELMKTMDSEIVEKLWAKHTKRRDPSVTLSVLEN